jgi:hypothetical protein
MPPKKVTKTDTPSLPAPSPPDTDAASPAATSPLQASMLQDSERPCTPKNGAEEAGMSSSPIKRGSPSAGSSRQWKRHASASPKTGHGITLLSWQQATHTLADEEKPVLMTMLVNTSCLAANNSLSKDFKSLYTPGLQQIREDGPSAEPTYKHTVSWHLIKHANMASQQVHPPVYLQPY